MAEAIPFKGQTTELGIGDHDPEKVYPLPVRIVDAGDGVDLRVSCWRLTKPEIDEVVRTGVVWLSVLGGMFPSKVDGVRPFEE